jgi:hypothetical protein
MAIAPRGISAFIDLFGADYVGLAADLGIAPARINTVIAFEFAQQFGRKQREGLQAPPRRCSPTRLN